MSGQLGGSRVAEDVPDALACASTSSRTSLPVREVIDGGRPSGRSGAVRNDDAPAGQPSLVEVGHRVVDRLQRIRAGVEADLAAAARAISSTRSLYVPTTFPTMLTSFDVSSMAGMSSFPP